MCRAAWSVRAAPGMLVAPVAPVQSPQQQNLGDMRTWRDKRRENFTPVELRLLDMLWPAFVTALARARVEALRPFTS